MATFGNHDFVWRKQAPYAFKVDQLVDYIHGDTTLKIWFSPWSNTFGGWAWMKDPDQLKLEYDNIPEGTDIIVSHQPPYGYGDQVLEAYRGFNEDPDGHVGSKELLNVIDKVKPKVVICGHIHSGYGVYQHGLTTIYNVALMDDTYQLVREATEIVL